MDDACQTYELPPTANDAACAGLAAFLAKARGKPVCLQAGAHDRPGTRLSLLMLAARRSWEAEGVAFRIEAPGEGLCTGLQGLGLEALLEGQEAAG
jgi:hypothetical protein